MEFDKTGEFFALLFRSNQIKRWGLMRNTTSESLSEHCYETALLSHILALIGNKNFGKSYNAEKLACAALYHDRCEILTGDLPTPVKYYNEEIKSAYKAIEKIAEEKMSSLLREDLSEHFSTLFNLSHDEKQIIKSADKLCAYIKCKKELDTGNKEFECAITSIKKQLDKTPCIELQYFMDNYLDSFFRQLDEVKL